MVWVTGIYREDNQLKFEVHSKEYGTEYIAIESISPQISTLPQAMQRRVFVEEIFAWTRSCGDEYCRYFGLRLPAGLRNQQTVFMYQAEDGTRVHVPALAFMQGFFKSNGFLFRRLFTPCNVDTLGFVDYACEPPAVIVNRDDTLKVHESRDEIVRWVLSSPAVRTSVQSIYMHALHGRVDFELPAGVFRLVLHGYQSGADLFATKVAAISVQLHASDSITSTEEKFFFHRMASPVRTVTPIHEFSAVPKQAGQGVELSESEWAQVSPLLRSSRDARQRYCRRALLNAILQKLSSGRTWKQTSAVCRIPHVNLTTTFRIWHLDGRFAKVLDLLSVLRVS